jgi:hypothetical protein
MASWEKDRGGWRGGAENDLGSADGRGRSCRPTGWSDGFVRGVPERIRWVSEVGALQILGLRPG